MNHTTIQRFAIGFLGTFIIGFVAVWIWVAQNLLTMMPNSEDVTWKTKSRMIQQCDIGALTILGDSGLALGLIPARIGTGVVNYAVGGTSPVDMWLFARAMLSCPSLPKAVLISFGIDRFTQYSSFPNTANKFGISRIEDLEKVRQYALDTQFNLGIPTADLITLELGYTYRFPPFYFFDMVSALRERWAEKNQPLIEEVIKSRGGWPDYGESHGSKQLSSGMGSDHFTALPFYDHYFQEILSLFEAHHIPVYYLESPVSDISMSAIKPTFISDYTGYLTLLSSRHPNFHFISPLFTVMPWTLFRDGDHLNRDGAMAWSEQVRGMLNEAHIEGSPFIAASSEDINAVNQ